MYEKACEFIEMSSKYFYIAYIKVSLPISTIPYLFMSYFNYYTTELGVDAFELPFVIWYDKHEY